MIADTVESSVIANSFTTEYRRSNRNGAVSMDDLVTNHESEELNRHQLLKSRWWKKIEAYFVGACHSIDLFSLSDTNSLLCPF